MEIILKVGKDEVMLRGGRHDYQLCWRQEYKRDGKPVVEWRPEKYYANLPSAFNAIMDMKIRASDVRTLEELRQEILSIRRELTELYNATV